MQLIVWREQRGGKVDQWALRDGTKVQGEKLGISEDTAFVVEEESCLSCGTDRRLREAQNRRAQSGGNHLANQET